MQALQEIGDRELDVTVVVGPSNLHGESLRIAAEHSRHSVRLISNVSDMPEVMAQADLAITAGGGTCCELAFMQVPMVLITIAKNQERPIRAYAAAKTAVAAGWFSSLESARLTRLLLDLIDNRSLRTELALNARKLVDGKGPQRIVEKMTEITGIVE
jgi:spore coat polysaccharide biosynthesis predicted glycosyltransferase SpsG